MRPLVFAALLLACLCTTVNSKPGTFEDTYGDPVDTENKDIQNDDYEGEYGEAGEETEVAPEESEGPRTQVIPEFKTKPQNIVARLGQQILLPCEITNPDFILVWRKDETKLLYQGDLPVKVFPNIKRTPQGLEVNITSEADVGTYDCQIMLSEENKPKITHTVILASPPRIVSIQTEGNRTVYSLGEDLLLSCVATGYPQPKISWHKGSERIEPTGENITITNLRPHNAGTYRCLADNDIAPPAHGHIEIHVEHKPIVSIDKYIVNSNHENDVELKCTVHAYPLPVVVWKKDGRNIVADPPKIVLKRHQNNVENFLSITNLTEADFGKYTCSAKNKFDKVERTVTLVKVPVVQEFVKPEKTNKDVVLTWKVESKSPIVEHQLQYRRKDEKEWRNLKPEVSNDGGDLYTVKYTLKGLEPGSYETRARSQNAHGWSEYSDVVPFEGVLAKNHKPHHKKHHKEKELKAVTTTPATRAQHQESESSVGASETSGSLSLTSSLCLTSLSLLLLHHRQ